MDARGVALPVLFAANVESRQPHRPCNLTDQSVDVSILPVDNRLLKGGDNLKLL
jgi:hypothetical protein